MEGINKTLDEAIRAKDIEEVRNVLTTSMVQDPGFSKGVFEERFKRCLIGLSETNIFDPFDGEPLNLNQSAWTKDYYAAQQTEFRYNFSLERLEHLKKVGRKLFPSAAPRPFLPDDEEAKKKTTGEENNRPGQGPGEQKEDFPKWLIPVGIGAAALILLWVLFG